MFAGGSAGFVHVIGPTGGYLLAFPAAAAVAGLAHRGGAGVGRVLLCCALGMVVIHLGGVAQLALLGGDPGGGVPHRLRAVLHRRSPQGRASPRP